MKNKDEEQNSVLGAGVNATAVNEEKTDEKNDVPLKRNVFLSKVENRFVNMVKQKEDKFDFEKWCNETGFEYSYGRASGFQGLRSNGFDFYRGTTVSIACIGDNKGVVVKIRAPSTNATQNFPWNIGTLLSYDNTNNNNNNEACGNNLVSHIELLKTRNASYIKSSVAKSFLQTKNDRRHNLCSCRQLNFSLLTTALDVVRDGDSKYSDIELMNKIGNEASGKCRLPFDERDVAVTYVVAARIYDETKALFAEPKMRNMVCFNFVISNCAFFFVVGLFNFFFFHIYCLLLCTHLYMYMLAIKRLV